MKFSKPMLIFLSGAGLLLFAACSNGQPTANSPSSIASPDSMAKTETAKNTASSNLQMLTPTTQTGDARMTLDASSLKQGKNTLTLTAKDSKDQAIAAKDVQVAVTMSDKEMEAMGMKGMGEGAAKTQVKPAAAPGAYAVETELPFGGNWQLKVDLKDAQPPASAVFTLPVK
ncbi:hypothetical protein LEP3755_63450 (plasmid) [Leptolyngbya sp. NIES-3755]|nr:hypothetical protein LEP3755_63450 [Leptolyngbya sp. NIES-3755]